jgi:protein ImuA
MKREGNAAIIEQLQKQIQTLQGGHARLDQSLSAIGLGALESSFPDKIFPKGVIHELISSSFEDAACTSGFMSVILGKLMHMVALFPPALKAFGIEPDRILFIDTTTSKNTLWALEEALKCDALTAVVGELTELSFNDSRRLQLAVERSQVTGFIHRHWPNTQNAVACVTRWKISPLASTLPGNMPGVGFPGWNVQLLKVRGGKPGEWQVHWSPTGLEYIQPQVDIPYIYERSTA